MTSAVIPPPPPPSFKNRRGWLIAFGIAEILIGCLLVLMIAFTVVTMRHVPPNPASPPPDARALAVMAAFYSVIALAFVIIGIGSIHARRWARVAMLIVAWIWLGIGVLTAIVMGFMLPTIMSNAEKQATAPMPAGANTIVGVFVMIGLFFIVLPLIFVLFYSGKNVRLTCENASPDAAPHKPVPVWIASGWFALGALGYLFILIKPGFPLLGLMLIGWQAIAAAAVMEVFMIWLAWNLYQQRRVAWNVAIAVLLFGWISTLITVARMGFLGMYRAMGYTEAELAQMLPFAKYGIIGGAVLGVGFLIFLVVTRKHFTPPQPATLAS